MEGMAEWGRRRKGNEMYHLPLHFRIWVFTPLIILILLACSYLQGPVTETSPSPVPEDSGQPGLATEADESQAKPEESVLDRSDPLSHLLDLYSIRFDLVATYPDQTSSSTQVEIDAAGNLHLKFKTPSLTGTTDQASTLSPDFEIYTVDETGYQFNSQENSWSTTSELIDYRMVLLEQMHGIEGPGLWLDILPDGSLQSAGEETVGGFTTEKVAVNGIVAEQTVTGSLWYDIESQALVRAELHIPAALLSISEEPVQGELKITLEAQKTDIPAITAPTPLNSTQTAP
jgi:hypothetical protein